MEFPWSERTFAAFFRTPMNSFAFVGCKLAPSIHLWETTMTYTAGSVFLSLIIYSCYLWFCCDIWILLFPLLITILCSYHGLVSSAACSDGKSQSRLDLNRDLNTVWEWFDSLKIRFGNWLLGFDSIRYFLWFDVGREIRQPNHCWLLLMSPFQCLVVSPVELTGFNCKQQR